jgi:hypothetical protein
MYKILAFLILIPSLAFADVMIYFYATPTFVANRLQNLSCRPDLAGGNAAVQEALKQSIIVATDPDVNNVAYATLIPDNLLAAARSHPKFLGKGLNEVKVNFPNVYSHIAQKSVRLENGTIVRLDMYEATPAGGTVLATDLPVQTFFGYNPMTGDPQ